MRFLTVLLPAAMLAGATLTAIATPAAAAGPADPCAGTPGASRIVDCLKPTGVAGATRGIRPSGAAPAGTTAGASAAAPPAASVNLSVTFGFGSADLTPQGMKMLDTLGQALKNPALADAKFQVTGHTDAVGSDDYNMKLSERRAEAARNYLVEHAGIPAARLTAEGYGRTRLYDPANPTAASNRRVEVIRMEN
jgi:OOP family OmpA-OmpF porin